MEEKKSNLAGFINGLQANNIMSNKMALEVYSSHMNSLMEKLSISVPDISGIIEMLKSESPSISIVDLFIKLGEQIDLSMPNNDNNIDIKREIALTYLKIAKVLKDKRIEDLAISIAKHLSSDGD